MYGLVDSGCSHGKISPDGSVRTRAQSETAISGEYVALEL